MMMTFLSGRRVLAASAAIITVAILAFLVGTYPNWRKAIGVDGTDQTALPPKGDVSASKDAVRPQTGDISAKPDGLAADQAGTPASTPAKPVPTQPIAPAAGNATPAASATDDAKAASTAGTNADQTGASADGPTFDIVRVEPSGDSVIAGRAKPGAEIVLLDQGRPIARAKADATGEVAFVPPPLAPGEHSLMLSVGEPSANGAVSAQSVSVSVAGQGKTAPMVALIAPGQPTKLLSVPASATGRPASGPAGTAPGVAVSSIDVEDLDGIFATGRAAPDSHCRVYLNGSFVAAVTAGKDGTWSLKIKRGMRPGRYSVRVDQLQSAAGQVQARAEVPFDYPDRAADGASLLRPKAAGKPEGTGPQPGPSTVATNNGSAAFGLAAPDAAGASSQPANPAAATGPASGAAQPGATPTVVTQLLTTRVIRGDSLWRISRKMLGHGLRYTQIYAANTAQIRDPKLIYPGQIFVMPQSQQ